MFPLSGAFKWKKKREIDSNVVKLQKISAFVANARDENDSCNKVCFNTKMIVMIAKKLMRRTQVMPVRVMHG